MYTKKIQKLLSLLILMIFITAFSVQAAIPTDAQTPTVSSNIDDIVRKYQQENPQLMTGENVPGLSS